MADIFIGIAILAVILVGAYVFTHRQAPVTASPKDIVTTVSSSLSDSWAEVKADLPRLINARVTELEGALATALQRAATAEAALVAEQQAKQAALDAVATAKTALGFPPPSGAT